VCVIVTSSKAPQGAQVNISKVSTYQKQRFAFFYEDALHDCHRPRRYGPARLDLRRIVRPMLFAAKILPLRLRFALSIELRQSAQGIDFGTIRRSNGGRGDVQEVDD